MKISARSFLWSLLAAWGIAVAVAYAYRHFEPEFSSARLAELDATTMKGEVVPLTPSDSVTVLLAVLADCSTCRVGVADYIAAARELREDGVALRIVVSSPEALARQYARLFPNDVMLIDDSSTRIYSALGIRRVPSLVVTDGTGSIVARESGPFAGGVAHEVKNLFANSSPAARDVPPTAFRQVPVDSPPPAHAVFPPS